MGLGVGELTGGGLMLATGNDERWPGRSWDWHPGRRRSLNCPARCRARPAEPQQSVTRACCRRDGERLQILLGLTVGHEQRGRPDGETSAQRRPLTAHRRQVDELNRKPGLSAETLGDARRGRARAEARRFQRLPSTKPVQIAPRDPHLAAPERRVCVSAADRSQ